MKNYLGRRRRPSAILVAALCASMVGSAPAADPKASAQAAPPVPTQWWVAGSGKVMGAMTAYPDPRGILAVLNAEGPVQTKGHPFFEPREGNGRACVTCHQPADGMSLSAATARERWAATNGKDPLFAAYDGSNCPDLAQTARSSHSLLLQKGLFRIAMPWPPKDGKGKPIDPDFTIEVVNDPTGCNTSKTWGLDSTSPHVSIFRRPRPAANLSYVDPVRPLGLFQVRSGEVFDLDPATGNRILGGLMADARQVTLQGQMLDASSIHLQEHAVLSKADVERIRHFERQLFAAQIVDSQGGSLQAGGADLGPQALSKGETAVLGGFPLQPAFPELEGWRTQSTLQSMAYKPFMVQRPLPAQRQGQADESPAERAFRDSVARGYDLFMYKSFLIRDVGSLNPLLGNPVKQTCTNCHNMQRMGLDNAPGYLGLGTTTYPTATPQPDLPLFKLTCRADRAPHPYLGRQIYTHDPGRALVTGKCADIGAIVAQQMRSLSARAPYFANGSAKTIREVVEFYDRRFNINYTEQEITDLVNFMGSL